MGRELIVCDTSAVIAALRDEPGGDRVLAQIADSVMSAVNFSELVTYAARTGSDVDELRTDLAALGVTVHAFDEDMAMVAGRLVEHTKPLGLSLGDRACLALGLALGAPIITTDRSWARLNIGAMIEVIR